MIRTYSRKILSVKYINCIFVTLHVVQFSVPREARHRAQIAPGVHRIPSPIDTLRVTESVQVEGPESPGNSELSLSQRSELLVAFWCGTLELLQFKVALQVLYHNRVGDKLSLETCVCCIEQHVEGDSATFSTKFKYILIVREGPETPGKGLEQLLANSGRCEINRLFAEDTAV